MPLREVRANGGRWKLQYFLHDFIVAMDYIPEGVERLMGYRRSAARGEANEPLKLERKRLQRIQKAATIVLEFFEGTQKDSTYDPRLWPVELAQELDGAVYIYEQD